VSRQNDGVSRKLVMGTTEHAWYQSYLIIKSIYRQLANDPTHYLPRCSTSGCLPIFSWHQGFQKEDFNEWQYWVTDMVYVWVSKYILLKYIFSRTTCWPSFLSLLQQLYKATFDFYLHVYYFYCICQPFIWEHFGIASQTLFIPQ